MGGRRHTSGGGRVPQGVRRAAFAAVDSTARLPGNALGRRRSAAARTDGKLALLRAADQTAGALRVEDLLRLGRAVEVVDARPGAVLVPPDAVGEWHHHVLVGQLLATAGGAAMVLGPGAVVVTRPGCTLTALTAARVAVTANATAIELRALAPVLLADPEPAPVRSSLPSAPPAGRPAPERHRRAVTRRERCLLVPGPRAHRGLQNSQGTAAPGSGR